MLCSLIIKPSIFAITQTRMNVNIICNVELPNYSIFQTDSLTSAGGAALYISTFLNSIIMSDIILDIPLAESVLVWQQVALTSDTVPGLRISKSGEVVIGGLFPVHVRGGFRSRYMSLAEAMIFAIEQINNDTTLLPNVTLGYDISDTNLTNRHAMNSTLDYVNVHKFAFTSLQLNETCSILPSGQLAPVVAVVGTGTSRSSILVSNLLEAEDIPLISYAATSDELSSSAYPSFFRTVPPDRFQSKVMSDIARYFNWTYVAAIAADDAYGRSGIANLPQTFQPRKNLHRLRQFLPHE